MGRGKKVTLIANMMIRDNDIPYLRAVIPELHEMCDSLVLMYNGPTRDYQGHILYLMNPEDNLIIHEQADPPNYSYMRNLMLEQTPNDVWVIRWDCDELPTHSKTGGGLINLSSYIAKHVPDGATKVAFPCYHITSETQCLKDEFGYSHVRTFLKDHNTEWRGNIHENIHCVGAVHTIPPVLGMASAHFSYYSPARLRRKERLYATIPGSGHGPGTLTRKLRNVRSIPDNVSWNAPEGWLEMIKELD